MKKIILNLLLTLAFYSTSQSQVFEVDTIQFAGDANKYINLVVMGDGYVANEQEKFIQDVNNTVTKLYNVSPWQNYASYFNIFAIKVISNESGAKHPNTATDCAGSNVPVSNPDNYFGSTFDNNKTHRAIVAPFKAKIIAVLAVNFPLYDQGLILVNTPYYGGTGGEFPTTTVEASSAEITLHELGHSFAQLADEYYAGEVFLRETPNMTKETNAANVKWKNWMGDNGIGIYKYCCGGTSASWNKPHQNCKMQFLGVPFCSVCSETIIEKIHSLVNPIVLYSPADFDVAVQSQFLDFKLLEVMKPSPNTLKIEWKLDNNLIAEDIDSVKLNKDSLGNGTHILKMVLFDTSTFLRVNNHSNIHFNMLAWTITKDNASLNMKVANNKISYSVYPNPTQDVLLLKIDSEKASFFDLKIINVEGKILYKNTQNFIDADQNLFEINTKDLISGTYYLVMNIDGNICSEIFIKQ